MSSRVCASDRVRAVARLLGDISFALLAHWRQSADSDDCSWVVDRCRAILMYSSPSSPLQGHLDLAHSSELFDHRLISIVQNNGSRRWESEGRKA